MASERDQMMKTANSSIKKVKNVRDACETAYQNVYATLQEVSNNWSGEAGNAMANALLDIYNDLKKAHSELDLAVKQMQKESKSIYNNWPSDD